MCGLVQEGSRGKLRRELYTETTSKQHLFTFIIHLRKRVKGWRRAFEMKGWRKVRGELCTDVTKRPAV